MSTNSENTGDGAVWVTRHELRAHLDAGTCPFCTRGPFRAILEHLWNMHGVPGPRVRQLAGVGRKTRFRRDDVPSPPEAPRPRTRSSQPKKPGFESRLPDDQLDDAMARAAEVGDAAIAAEFGMTVPAVQARFRRARRNTPVEQVYALVAAGRLRIDSHGRVWRGDKRAEQQVWPNGPRNAPGTIVVAGKATVSAGRLVWRHLHGPVPPGAAVEYRDGDSSNTRPDNLHLRRRKQRSVHHPTTCPRGLHPRAPEYGAYHQKHGKRVWVCRSCVNETARRRRVADKHSRTDGYTVHYTQVPAAGAVVHPRCTGCRRDLGYIDGKVSRGRVSVERLDDGDLVTVHQCLCGADTVTRPLMVGWPAKQRRPSGAVVAEDFPLPGVPTGTFIVQQERYRWVERYEPCTCGDGLADGDRGQVGVSADDPETVVRQVTCPRCGETLLRTLMGVRNAAERWVSGGPDTPD